MRRIKAYGPWAHEDRWEIFPWEMPGDPARIPEGKSRSASRIEVNGVSPVGSGPNAGDSMLSPAEA